MDINRFTEKAQEALPRPSAGRALGQQQIDVEHSSWPCSSRRTGLAVDLRKADVDLDG